jgi:3-oxoacyl-[acyl-carrier protein] reductase
MQINQHLTSSSTGDLRGKTALITGASRGIGFAIASALAKEGVNIAVNSRSAANLEHVKRELSSYGVKVLACPADLSDASTPAKIIGDIITHFGQLNILVNNAGVAVRKPLAATTANEWDMHMAINARAPFLLSREAIPYLKKSDHATIINISSVVGSKAYVNQGAYTASKHALEGMSKVLAQEVFQDGIRVHVIASGGVATGMITGTRPDLDVSVLPAPEEIADIVLFLLTHRGNAVIDKVNVRRSTKSPWT